MSIYSRLQNRLLLSLFLLTSFVYSQSEYDTGTLSITLNSPGFIYVDSQYLSNATVENLVLKSGEYKISVFSSETRKWNERGFEKIIKIEPNQNFDLIVESTNLYYINTNPYNSRIIQNDKILGNTPVYMDTGDFNLTDRIIIEKPGYIDKEVFVTPNQYEYFFNLKPESIKSEINIASPGLDNSQTKWFKEGFVVVSLLSSWAAFYFKREADSNYDKYLQTGNPVRMNKYYDKTKKFDTYTDVSITVSLVSLGTYMYFLIFD